MGVDQIKESFERYMKKEIHEQPESLETTIRGILVHGAKRVLLEGLKDHLRAIRSRTLVCFACGSSYNAALATRPIIEELTVEIASDLLDRQDLIFRYDTVVSLSQSGETADTLQALDYALENGALCVGITNGDRSSIARKTHCSIHVNAGLNICEANNTRVHTTQIVVMVMFALPIGADTISSLTRREAIIDGLFDLPIKVKVVLKLDQEMKDLAKLIITEKSILVLGRGYNYATALEGSLKLKEVSLMLCEGILAGDLKYGPLALVDDKLPVPVIATRDTCFSKQQMIIQQLYARKARLIVICEEGDAEFVSFGQNCRVIEVPRVEDCLQPVVITLFLFSFWRITWPSCTDTMLISRGILSKAGRFDKNPAQWIS